MTVTTKQQLFKIFIQNKPNWCQKVYMWWTRLDVTMTTYMSTKFQTKPLLQKNA